MGSWPIVYIFFEKGDLYSMDENLRIPFLAGEYAAHRDKTILEAWFNGTIGTQAAIIMMSENNRCEVTEEQFLFNAKWLGYYDDSQ